ncbi:MAG: hypothetical protein ACOCXT_02125 [Candidatus Dojkabacteria bacterium]
MAVSKCLFEYPSPNAEYVLWNDPKGQCVWNGPQGQCVTVFSQGLGSLSSIAVGLVHPAGHFSTGTRLKVCITADTLTNSYSLYAQRIATVSLVESGRLISGNPSTVQNLITNLPIRAQAGIDIVLGTVRDQVIRGRNWRPLGAFIHDKDPCLKPFIGYWDNESIYHSLIGDMHPMSIHRSPQMNAMQNFTGTQVTSSDLVQADGYFFLQGRINPGVSLVLGVNNRGSNESDPLLPISEQMIAAVVTFPQ